MQSILSEIFYYVALRVALLIVSLPVLFGLLYVWAEFSSRRQDARAMARLSAALCPACARAYGEEAARQAYDNYVKRIRATIEEAIRQGYKLRLSSEQTWAVMCPYCRRISKFDCSSGALTLTDETTLPDKAKFKAEIAEFFKTIDAEPGD